MPAARIGPTVCELDGPIPILNRSKALIVMPELLPLQACHGLRRRHAMRVGQSVQPVSRYGAPVPVPCRVVRRPQWTVAGPMSPPTLTW